jgi:hypothetical protein
MNHAPNEKLLNFSKSNIAVIHSRFSSDHVDVGALLQQEEQLSLFIIPDLVQLAAIPAV